MVAREQVANVALRLPALRSITLQLEVSLDDLEESMRTTSSPGSPVIDFFAWDPFSDGSTNKEGSERVRIDRAFVLTQNLYCVNEQPFCNPHVADMLACADGNRIAYRATPAPGPTYSWHGLDLEVVTVGAYDLDDAVAQARWHREAEM